MKRNHGFRTNQGTNEQSRQQDIYEEVDMPELHTYEKTPKSEHGIVQNSQEQQLIPMLLPDALGNHCNHCGTYCHSYIYYSDCSISGLSSLQGFSR